MHNGGNGSLIKIHSFPLPGTTFPPNRFANGGDLVSKYSNSAISGKPGIRMVVFVSGIERVWISTIRIYSLN